MIALYRKSGLKRWLKWSYCVLTIGLCSGQNTGSISGRVQDELGAAFLSGVRISAVLLPDNPKTYTPFVAHGQSNPDGSYRLANLAAGKYEICLQALTGDYVDNCRWGKADAVPTVGAGASVSLNLRLTKGKVFSIEVDDKDQFLDRHEGKSPGGVFAVGVATKNREFVRATLSQDSKIKRAYRVVVPAATEFSLKVFTVLFDVESEKGNAEPLRVVEDLPRQILENEAGKSVKIQIRAIKALSVSK